jgi:hypothetical protein
LHDSVYNFLVFSYPITFSYLHRFDFFFIINACSESVFEASTL